MPIYYRFPELVIKREGSGNSTEISTDSMFQDIGRHYGSEQQQQKEEKKREG